jgi:hypothetical protein
MLEPAELALDGRALAVQVLEPLALARDERVQPVKLHPHRLRGARAGGAAPLGRLAPVVGTRKRRLTVRAVRRLGSTALTAPVSLIGMTRAIPHSLHSVSPGRCQVENTMGISTASMTIAAARERPRRTSTMSKPAKCWPV